LLAILPTPGIIASVALEAIAPQHRVKRRTQLFSPLFPFVVKPSEHYDPRLCQEDHVIHFIESRLLVKQIAGLGFFVFNFPSVA
jgi:hypothetical protein